MSRISDRLAEARRSRMVGRESERALFHSLLEADELPFCLLHVSGPGGVGKTTLLQAFRDLCARTGAADAVPLDARDIEPSPSGFLSALRAALNLAPSEDPFAALGDDPARRRVLFVDTYETLEMLDAWVREAFLPRLPANTLVVLAGRTTLPAAWRADPGWQSLLRTFALRNLSPAEARAYLTASAVPESQHRAALEFTHGHPLALSLVVDVFTQGGGGSFVKAATAFDSDAVPDVVQELLDRLVEEVPGPAHRTALELCALVRLLDESLLAEALKEDGADADAPALFEWLCGLSFVEKGSRGVFPHDIVREALLSDLRWRNRERYGELHRRARAYYTRHLRSADGVQQQSMLYDCVFLHRDNAVIRAAFTWQEDNLYPDTLRSSDCDAVERMVARHEGEESARIARHWLERQPESTLVFRDASAGGPSSGEPIGFLTMLGLHLTSEEERAVDPAARTAWEYLASRHAPLRPGEGIAFMRFWMAGETYQGMSPVQSLIVVNALRQFLTRPRLAFTFFACGDVAHWEPVFGYIDIPRLPEAEFAVGGRSYGVFGSDWRETPASVWLARLAEKETRAAEPSAASAAASADAPAPAVPRPQPAESSLLVLSEADFRDAVRDALRAYTNETGLRRSPLLRSALVAGRAGTGADVAARVTALRALLGEAAQALAASPRLARGYRALHHTYFQPSATQDQAADLLDLPFSTYRRHLTQGTAELTEALWAREIGDSTA